MADRSMIEDKSPILLTFERVSSLLQSYSFEPEVLDNIQEELENARDTFQRVENILHEGLGIYSSDVDSATDGPLTHCQTPLACHLAPSIVVAF